MNKTPLLKTVLEILKEQGRPLSVPDLLGMLLEKGFSPNKTTLYRMMERLVESGSVRSLLVDSKTTFYEQASKHEHHHFSCQKCAQVFCIEDKKVASSFSDLGQRL